MAKKETTVNVICKNRNASFRFHLLEQFECGLVLRGTEVKSLRDRAVSLDEAFARIEDGEIWLFQCHIAPYPFGQHIDHQPMRRKKVLVRKSEIRKLLSKVKMKGFTLVPVALYFNERGIAKLTLALAKGKAEYDKREAIRKRQDKREMARAAKQFRR